ncbi:MAG: four-carbon acid sugar kinase family protein [Anaerotruncus sp.]|nr:four-carbon acid sugar kinase family protein [Anaerotruncus sp.]
MLHLTMITDDLSGAADSGSYYTERGQQLTIFTSKEETLVRQADEIVAVNLSSRNTEGALAKSRHFQVCEKLKRLEPQLFMKKIGTGFRGNDAYELEGLLEAMPDYYCFLVDNAPDLGTFTLYGDQYCEGQILHKSLYAKDPIMPPTKSYIPEILMEHTHFSVGLVDIDAVKGETLAQKTAEQLAAGHRILVFDAITRQDTLHILQTLAPLYPKVFWTGSLGIADGLATYLYGAPQPHLFQKRPVRSLCFCASAYEMAKKQVEKSRENGLLVTELEIDALLDGDESAKTRAVADCLEKNRRGNVMFLPRVQRYSYQPGVSQRIMQAMGECAQQICQRAQFERIAVIGGETAQEIFARLAVGRMRLTGKLEPGVAEGEILDGLLAGKEFAIKGGSVGSVDALEKMLCNWVPQAQSEAAYVEV